MEDPSRNLLMAIRHYQESLERHSASKNEAKLLHAIERLHRLPIRVSHLEKTGVGRTVNSLRKLGGSVGEAAKALVSKWKDMVVEEERQEEEEDEGLGEENENTHEEDEEEEQEIQRKASETKPVQETSSSHGGESSKPGSSKKQEDTHHHKKKHSKRRKYSSSESSSDEAPLSKKLVKSEEESEAEDQKSKHHKSKKSSHKSHKKSKEEKPRRSHSDHKKPSEDPPPKKKHKTDHHKTSSDKKPKKEPKKSKEINNSNKKVNSTIQNGDGVTSGSGTSFEEALGGWATPSLSKRVSSPTSKKKPSSSAHSSASSSKTKPKEPTDNVPKLLKEPVQEPLDLNLSALLPTITPHYRPLGNLALETPQKRVSFDDEALSRVITSKNQRTKVYSGNKMAWGKVPTLFDICTRVLQSHIDALEYTGGVPYGILKPILEKANPDQLFVLEHHNPYLVEDTDELWQLHCKREFRNKKLDEMESWRDLYMKSLDEREAKLKALTANIKQAQDKSLPVRTTKLAYVDDVVKPPRHVVRKQIKNGTSFDKRPMTTPASRLSSLATAGEAGKVSVPNPGSRAVERGPNAGGASGSMMKPKKAPLMAKTLSLFKNRFRR